jgi:hypothetical protein
MCAVMSSTPGRGRRLSSSSLDASLFPIYEDPGSESIHLFSDLESTAGSEVTAFKILFFVFIFFCVLFPVF